MRKKKAEAHENLERWLLTYSDMITLLMLFFIILYSMSNVDKAKYQQISGALESVFAGGNWGIYGDKVIKGQGGILPGGRGIMDNSGQLPSEKGRSTLRKAARVSSIRAGLKQELGSKKLNVVSNEIGIAIILEGDLMFEEGSSGILPENSDTLNKIAKILSEIDNNVRVEGHTDDQPLKKSNALYNNNWELSSARATKVVQYLIENGVNPSHLSAVSYGSTKPRVSNNTPEDRALNRRVEITIVDKKTD
jgi:chemotaxis protein MotB